MGEFLTGSIGSDYFYYDPATMTYKIYRQPRNEVERRIIELIEKKLNNAVLGTIGETQSELKKLMRKTHSEVSENEWLALLED